MSHRFVLLPAEIRLKIWDDALDNEIETRFLLYYGMGGHVPHTYVDDRAVFFPHSQLRSNLCKHCSVYSWLQFNRAESPGQEQRLLAATIFSQLHNAVPRTTTDMSVRCCSALLTKIPAVVVNHESRGKALRFYHVKLPVHNCPRNLRVEMSRCPRQAMDNLPESPTGFIYIRPERETVIYNMEFNIYENWPLNHLVGVCADISVAIREKFRHVWSECLFIMFPVLTLLSRKF